MKKIFLIIIALLAVNLSYSQSNTQSWEEANKAYEASEYGKAIELYTSIVNSGEESAKLYYNLGSAYFKAGNVGKSLVNLYRAERLAPGDADTRYNIMFVNTRIQDKIEAVPQFFLIRWVNSIRSMMSSNGWAYLSIMSLAVTLMFVIIYLLSSKLALRKMGFYLGVVFAVLFFITTIMAASAKNAAVDTKEAVVVVASVAVKASPGNESKDVFVVHEGLKMEVIREVNGFYEIEIADGNRGWIELNAVEVI